MTFDDIKAILDKHLIHEATIDLNKLDVDEAENISREYGIMSIPTLLLFEDGKLVNKIVGLRSREDLIEQFK